MRHSKQAITEPTEMGLQGHCGAACSGYIGIPLVIIHRLHAQTGQLMTVGVKCPGSGRCGILYTGEGARPCGVLLLEGDRVA